MAIKKRWTMMLGRTDPLGVLVRDEADHGMPCPRGMWTTGVLVDVERGDGVRERPTVKKMTTMSTRRRDWGDLRIVLVLRRGV